MSGWSVVAVPLSLGLLALLLMATAWLEQRVLSPRSLILRTTRVRNAAPEHVEQFVAAQCELLLKEHADGLQPTAATRS